MAYRKFTADRVFTGYEMLPEAPVIVTDAEGTIVAIIPAEEAGSDVETMSGLLSPGFINCHCHLELSHMKGVIPEHTGMVPFLLTVMGKRFSDPSHIARAIEDAESSMIANGIVAVGDICNTDHTIIQKAKGCLYYYNFIEALGFSEEGADARFMQAIDLQKKFGQNNMPASVVPHAPYSVSEKLFKLIDEHEPGSLLSIHMQESNEEDEFLENGTGSFLELFRSLGINVDGLSPRGKNGLHTVLPSFSSSHSMVLVHNVVTNNEDMEWVRLVSSITAELFWCLCPNANLYISNRLPDVKMLRDSHEVIVIGTDSLASNHELNVLSELKTLQKYFPWLKEEELLTWATSNGARALRVQDRFGDLSIGKKPGLILIEGIENGSLANAQCRPVL